MDETTRTYVVPTCNVETTVAALRKLAQRAARLHVALPVWTVSAPHLVERRRDERTVTIDVVDITVSLAPVKLAGWTLSGTLDFSLGAEPIVSWAPHVVEPPAAFRTATNHCDHCGLARKRALVVLLSHEDGRTAQIGRSCVRDYLGHEAEALVARNALVAALGDLLGGAEDEGWIELRDGTRTRPFLHLGHYLAWVAATIRQCGWVSRGQAKAYNDAGGHRTSTSELALAAEYRASIGKPLNDDPKPPTDADRETVAAAIAWAEALPGESDYEHNLRLLASAGVLKFKHAGLAASMVASYLRHLDQLAEAKRAATSTHHVGTVGARAVFDLVCHGEPRMLESDWGVTALLTFVTADGARVKWFASGEAPEWFDDGAPVRLRATVKKHGEFKGYKETVVSRAMIEPTDEEKAARKAAAKARAKARKTELAQTAPAA